EYKEIKFWGYLDYAGISAYFPLSKKEKPSYGEIKSTWNKWMLEIEEWQKTHGKPVIFPEIGYKSCEGTAREPWGHDAEGGVDLKQQEYCYRAALETFWDKEWFYGMYWWVWRTKAFVSGTYDTSFSPNDKPALKTVNEWYTKPDPHKYKTIMETFNSKIMNLNKKS
ncbi:MAG: hypothetical protein HQL29_04730, partial [Candidatus Omnitrophica bacterium]|nr:hypothetical protein [Candidatus Omnitrophota bacterium]